MNVATERTRMVLSLSIRARNVRVSNLWTIESVTVTLVADAMRSTRETVICKMSRSRLMRLFGVTINNEIDLQDQPSVLLLSKCRRFSFYERHVNSVLLVPALYVAAYYATFWCSAIS